MKCVLGPWRSQSNQLCRKKGKVAVQKPPNQTMTSMLTTMKQKQSQSPAPVVNQAVKDVTLSPTVKTDNVSVDMLAETEGTLISLDMDDTTNFPPLGQDYKNCTDTQDCMEIDYNVNDKFNDITDLNEADNEIEKLIQDLTPEAGNTFYNIDTSKPVEVNKPLHLL